MLAGHQRMVAQVIRGGISHVAGGEDVLLAYDLKVRVHMQTPKPITLSRSPRTAILYIGCTQPFPDHVGRQICQTARHDNADCGELIVLG